MWIFYIYCSHIWFLYLLPICFGFWGVAYSSKIEVMDETPANTRLGQVFPSSYIAGNNTRFYMRAQNYNISTTFAVSELTGELYSRKVVDRELLCQFVLEQNQDCEINLEIFVTPNGIEFVTIIILDKNDHAPEFPQQLYKIHVKESDSINSLYSLPLAKDKDSLKFSVQEYLLQPINSVSSGVFDLKETTEMIKGDNKMVISELRLRLKSSLDREKISSYLYNIIAFDGGDIRKSGTMSIIIMVDDFNDNGPIFQKPIYYANITERDKPASAIVTLQAYDKDEGSNAVVHYAFAESSTAKAAFNYFLIKENTGELFVKNPLDYETVKSPFEFSVIAYDVGHVDTSTATVIVSIIDINDEIPEIVFSIITGKDLVEASNTSLRENHDPGVVLAYVTATDKDTGENGQLFCNLVEPADKVILKTLPNENGLFYTIETLVSVDREVTPYFDIVVQCYDNGFSIKNVANKTLRVTLLDENDCTPKLSYQGNFPNISENRQAGTKVIQIIAEDLDYKENGTVSFSLDGSEEISKSFFKIDPVTGWITTVESIDRENNIYAPLSQLPIVVTGRDHGSPSRSSTLAFDIDIIDENDNPPSFDQELLELNIDENMKPGSVVEVTVKDHDKVGNLHVFIPSSQNVPFVIYQEASRIMLNTTQPLDYERHKEFRFIIVAQDDSNGAHHKVNCSVIVTVLNTNDHSPEIIYPSLKNRTFHLSHKEYKSSILLTVTVKDKDHLQGGNFIFEIFNLKGDFLDIDPDEGKIYVKRRLNEADIGHHLFTVVVRDTDGVPREVKFNITVIVDKITALLGYDLDPHQTTDSSKDASFWGSDYIIICALVLFLLLLILCILTFFYMRHWRTGAITWSQCMFGNCFKATTIDVQSSHTKNVDAITENYFESKGVGSLSPSKNRHVDDSLYSQYKLYAPREYNESMCNSKYEAIDTSRAFQQRKDMTLPTQWNTLRMRSEEPSFYQQQYDHLNCEPMIGSTLSSQQRPTDPRISLKGFAPSFQRYAETPSFSGKSKFLSSGVLFSSSDPHLNNKLSNNNNGFPSEILPVMPDNEQYNSNAGMFDAHNNCKGNYENIAAGKGNNNSNDKFSNRHKKAAGKSHQSLKMPVQHHFTEYCDTYTDSDVIYSRSHAAMQSSFV